MVLKRLSLTLALLLFAFGPTPARSADLSGALLALLDQMEAGYARINDYTAVFTKLERVKKVLQQQESALLKYQKPLKVYMKFLEGPAREALYVQGENGSKVFAYCPGLLGFCTWTFNPRDKALMDGNRHAITEVGFGYVIEMMRQNIPKAISHGELEIKRLADDTFNGRPVILLEATFTPQDPSRKYYTTHMVLHIDKQYLVPIGIACYDAKGEVEEKYAYTDVKVNVGLTPDDFSTKNKDYKF